MRVALAPRAAARPTVSASGRHQLARHAQQIVGRRAAHRVEVARLGVEPAAAHVEAAELRARPETLSRSKCSAARKLMRAFSSSSVAHRLRAQPLDLGDASPRSRSATRAGVGVEVDRGGAGVERRVAPRVDPLDEPVALLHRAHEAAALAVAEQEREQVEVGRVGVRERDARIGELERGALERPREQRAAQARAARGSGRRARRAPLGARPANALLHALEHLVAVEAARPRSRPGCRARTSARRSGARARGRTTRRSRACRGSDGGTGARRTRSSNTALLSTLPGESSLRRISSSTTSISRAISSGSKTEWSTASQSTSMPVASASAGSVAW